jgi:predicted porin
MKNFIPSMSALSIGAASLAVTAALQASEGGAKPWTVRAGVSGFYNDNVYTRSDLPKVDSFGFEVTPGFSLNLPINDGQTTLGLRYDYLLRYFENREKSLDHNHVVDASLTHNFNSRYKINVFDSFAQAQEPQQLGAGAGGAGILFRAEGTNFRNIAGFDFTSELAENWSAVTGFRNNLFRFDALAFAQSLDRVEYLPSVNVRYQVAPKSSVGLFYQYGITDYDGPGSNVGFVRDVNSHFVAATIDHDFAANLTGSLRGGIQYNDFADVAGIKSRDGVSPYVDGQVAYGFLPGSSLTVGVRHQLTATDVGILGAVGGGLFSDPIRGSSATSARLGVSHSFTPKLVGSINGLYQMGNFIGGGPGVDGKSDSYASGDVTLSYRITQNISTRVSYAHDRVDSDLVNDLREFARNRVFLGVNFTY